MKKSISRSGRSILFLASNKFFLGIVALLCIQAAWIAITGRYPMAFDENFHLGIIRLYSHHLSPFWQQQPAGADVFGVITRDPSYLYQYVMSFPYRLIRAFTNDQTIQVLWLRAINIGLFATGLFIYRRLLLETKASRAIVNCCLLLFVLIPVVPMLAAQINYDNMFFPLTGLTILLTVKFLDNLKANKHINIKLLAGILVLCFATSLVKYAFLPFFAVILIFLILAIWRQFNNLAAIYQELKIGLRSSSKMALIIMAFALIVAGGLFVERYVVNTYRYHAPVPECTKVLTEESCSSYGPWLRDHNFELLKTSSTKNPIIFNNQWLYGMWLRLFFTVGGTAADYDTKGPFIIPAYSAIVFGFAGLVVFLAYSKAIWKKYNSEVLNLLAVVTILYIITLWLDEFRAYIKTGQPVAINGRYLLPILLFVMLMFALGFNELLKERRQAKITLFAIVFVSLIYGGGALTFILRSNQLWYWQNPTVVNLNQSIQRNVGPLIVGNSKQNQFLR